jgi:hypothetical protein
MAAHARRWWIGAVVAVLIVVVGGVGTYLLSDGGNAPDSMTARASRCRST